MSEWEWSCQCGEAGTTSSFMDAYFRATYHAQHNDHNFITIVECDGLSQIVDGLIAEAEAIVKGVA